MARPKTSRKDEPPLPTRKKGAKVTKPDAKRGRKKTSDAPNTDPTTSTSFTKTTSTTSTKTTSTKTADAALPVTEADILAADTLAKVVAFVNLLVGLQQQQFEQYKHTVQQQMEHDARLIAELRRELENKQTSVDALLALLARAPEPVAGDAVSSSTPQRRRPAEMYELPIRGRNSSLLSQHELAGELKTIGVTLDMLELLTGMRIINYEEDMAKFYFDVKQLSTSSDSDADAVSVVYRLVIKRKFELTAEVTYIPTFLDSVLAADSGDAAADARAVAAYLPEYLKDSLIFPYNTLLQFYAKMSKALNKSAKA